MKDREKQHVDVTQCSKCNSVASVCLGLSGPPVLPEMLSRVPGDAHRKGEKEPGLLALKRKGEPEEIAD